MLQSATDHRQGQQLRAEGNITNTERICLYQWLLQYRLRRRTFPCRVKCSPIFSMSQAVLTLPCVTSCVIKPPRSSYFKQVFENLPCVRSAALFNTNTPCSTDRLSRRHRRFLTFSFSACVQIQDELDRARAELLPKKRRKRVKTEIILNV